MLTRKWDWMDGRERGKTCKYRDGDDLTFVAQQQQRGMVQYWAKQVHIHREAIYDIGGPLTHCISSETRQTA